MSTTELNITFDLIEQARLNPQRIALVIRDQSITYWQLDVLTWQSAGFLHEKGIRPGDIVALIFTDSLKLALALLGLARLGATALTIPVSSTAFQRKEWSQTAGAQTLLSDHPTQLDSAMRPILFKGSLLAEQRFAKPEWMDEAPRSPWMIVLGSGSTGTRKLIPIKHAQLRDRIGAHSSILLDKNDKILFLTTLEYPTSSIRLFDVIRRGGAYFFPVPTHAIPDYCESNQITILVATVFHIENLLAKMPDSATPRLGSLRALRVAGSTVTHQLRSRIKKQLTEHLIVGYGANECGSMTRCAPPEVFDDTGSVGRPATDVSLEIVDPLDHPLPHGVVGRIRVKTPGMFEGYLNDPESTGRSLIDGWFYPGDLGKMTPDGQLIHCGRGDQMMIFNGINIYPAEIEQCVTGHPAVTDATAFPLKSPVHQDVPVCAISLLQGSAITENELLAYLNERLGFRSPKRLIALKKIPRNEQGKIIRHELMAQVNRFFSQGRARPLS